jgi:hypothetical protein
MPKYQIEVPGSGTFEVDSPTDLSDAQAYQAVMGQIKSTPTPKGGIMGALALGAKSLTGSQLTGIKGLFGDANQAAQQGIARQEELGQQYAAPTSLEAVKKIYQEKGLLSAAGEVASQIPKAIAQQAPQLGETFAGARVGAMVAGPWGAVAGAAIPNLVQFFGTNLERQAQEQIKSGQPVNVEAGKAALAAVPQTAIDLVETRLLFGSKFLSGALGISEKSLAKMSTEAVEKQAQEKLIPLLLKGTAKGVATEIPSEIAQQMLERAQAGLPLTTPDAVTEYGNTAYQVSLLGPLGAAGRLSTRGGARDELSKREGVAAAEAAITAEQAKGAMPTPPDETGQMGLNLLGAQEAAGPQVQTPAVKEIERSIFALQQQEQTPQIQQQIATLQAQLPAQQEQPLVGPEQPSPQMALDFEQPYPKSRLPSEPPIVGQGEQPKPPQISDLDFAKMRLESGAPLTPTQQFLLQEDRAQQRSLFEATPAPQLEIPTVVGAGARPTSYVVDDRAINSFGVTKAANAFKNAVRGLDLMNPDDAAKFDDLVAKHERKNAKINMDAVEAFKAEKPEPVAAREVPEREPLPARPYDARKAYQQARETQFAFGQVGAPLSPRDIRAQAKAEYDERTGAGAVNGPTDGGVQLPSVGVQATEGTTTPEATGMGSPVGLTTQPDGGAGVSGENGPAALAQMVQQVAPVTKPKLREAPAKLAPKEESVDELLARLGVDISATELTPEELLGTPEASQVTETAPITGTKLQQNKEFAKRMGYVSGVGGHRLKGAVNNKMINAAKAGDIKGVLDALSKSKSPVYRQIADLAKNIKGLKVAVDSTKIEKKFSKFKQGIDSAKITIANIDALREAKRRVDAGEKLNEVARSIIQFPEGLTPDVKVNQTLASTLFSNNALFDNDAFYKYVAEQEAMLDGYEESNRYAAGTPVEIEAIPGLYDPETNTVYLDDYFGKYEDVLAHELTHAISHDFVSSPSAKNTPTYKALDKLYQHVLTQFSDKEAYGLSSLDEFVSEGLSNPLFQKELSEIKYENTTVWNKFVEMIAKILGLKADNAFTELLNLTTTAAEQGQSERRGGGPAFAVLPDAVKKWFGDSIAIDENGEPLVLYHGTSVPPVKKGTIEKDFDQFKLSPSGALGAGIYLTPNTEFADIYASAENGRVIPTIVKITNPLILKTEQGKDPMVDALIQLGVPSYKAEKIVEKAYDEKGYITREVMSRAQAAGYDGIFQYRDGKLTEVVAYSPYQVKSIFNKNPSVGGAKFSLVPKTAEGKAAESLMSAFGGKPADVNQGFIQKQVSSFNKAKDSWTQAYEGNNDWVASTFGKAQNIASFDQAFNNRLYNHFMGEAKKGNMVMEDAKKALLRVSTSQALHRGNLANQIIEKGDYIYDAPTNRWDSKADPVNMTAFEGLIKSLATKLGVEPTRARQIMGAAYEANRLNGMYKSLDQTEKDITSLEAELSSLRKNRKRTKADQKEIDLKTARLDKLRTLEEDLNGKVRHKTKAQVDAGMELYNAYPEIKEGTKVWNKMRERVVNLLVESGVKTKEEAERWLDEAAYVPFFRDMEDQKAAGPQVMARGLRESMIDRTMKGSMREVQDPIENMYQWMQWSIARAISNKQLQVMLDQYKEALPNEVRSGEGGAGNTFTVYYDGTQRKFNVADPAIAQAFVGLEPIIFPGIGAAVSATNALRHIITRFPLFSAVQLFNDSYTAMFTSGLKSPFGVLKEIAKEVAKTAQGTSETRKMLIGKGILETTDYSAMNEEDAIAKRLDLDNPSSWKKLMRNLDRLSSASDNVIRQGVYNQAIKEKLSHEEAMEKAAEIVNFRRISGDPRLQFASRVIPFFNAYLQVGSVAVKTLSGRGISPTERKAAQATLLATTAKIAVLSMLYSMAVGDDEDYKRKNRVTRDRMFMIPGTGGYGIPIRADVFALPKIIGEYSYQMMADNGTTDPKMFKEAMGRAVMNSLHPPSEGIPQIVRPALGVMTNYDFFQDREIVNATMRRLDTDRQFTKNTSEMAKALGALSGMSPLNIDYLLRGYFGSAMTLTALATDDAINAVRGGPARPAKSANDMIASLPNMSGFMSKDENTAVLSDFYQVARDVNKASATLKSMKHRPMEEQRAYREEHQKELKLKPMVQTLEKQLVLLKQREQMVRESPKMDDVKKQAELKRINDQRDRMVKNVLKLRQKMYD